MHGVTDDVHLCNEKLREWEDYYDYHRPHGVLDAQTSYERLVPRRERECYQRLRTTQCDVARAAGLAHARLEHQREAA
jgi:hypothetical protein